VVQPRPTRGAWIETNRPLVFKRNGVAAPHAGRVD